MFTQDDEISIEELQSGYVLAKRYEILSFIGSGGMGSVYLAEDKLLESHVALKVLHKEFARDPKLTQRFIREVKLMNKVNHQNVVRTFDVGSDTNYIYYTMEYIEGVVLDEYLRCVGNHPSIITRLILQLCRGLDAIHANGIVHRDLKPSNIIVASSGCVKITDFGVARTTNSNLTNHREIMGSLDYLAPEIVVGQEVSTAVDFYSLGMILYEAVTGQIPFVADDLATLMWMHVHNVPEPPKNLNPNTPDWLNDLIVALTAKSPSDRPRSAGEIVERLRPFLTEDITWQGASGDGSEVFYSMKASRSTDQHPTITGNEEPEANSSSSLGSAVVTTQDAYNNIIFDVLPTMEEIIEHEKKFAKDKVRRVGPGTPEAEAQEAAEEAELKEIQRLRRSIYVLCTLVLIGLGGLVYVSLKQSTKNVKPEYNFPNASASASYASAAKEEQQKKLELPDFSAAFAALDAVNAKLSGKWGGDSGSGSGAASPAGSTRSGRNPTANELAGIPDGGFGSKRVRYEASVAPAPFEKSEYVKKYEVLEPVLSEVSDYKAEDSSKLQQLPSVEARQNWDQREQLRLKLREVSAKLTSLGSGSGGGLSNQITTLERKLAEARNASRDLQAELAADAKRHQYWSHLARSLDSQDILSLSRQMEGASDTVSARRKAYEQASHTYFEVVDAISRGEPTKLTREEAGAALESARLELRAAVGQVIQESLSTVIRTSLSRNVTLKAVEAEERRLLLELELLRKASVGEGGWSKEQLLQERTKLEAQLKDYDQKISSEDAAALRRSELLQ